MKVDFYIYSPHEIFVFENVWQILKDLGVQAYWIVEPPGINTARRVSSGGRSTFHSGGDGDSPPLMDRTAYRDIILTLEQKGYPINNLSSDDADAVVTTGSSVWLYRYETAHKVKLFNGIHPHVDWIEELSYYTGFDAVFVHGEFQRKIMSEWYAAGNIFVTGFPKYVPLYKDEIGREEARQFYRIDSSKKTIVYFIADCHNSTFERFGSAVIELAGQYNVILKFQPSAGSSSFAKMRSTYESKPVVVDTSANTLIPFLAVADLILADVRSVELTESCLANKPIIGLSNNHNPVNDKLYGVIEQAIPVCRHTLRLPSMVKEHLENDHFFERRNTLRRHMFTDLYGEDATITAKQIIRLVTNRLHMRNQRTGDSVEVRRTAHQPKVHSTISAS